MIETIDTRSQFERLPADRYLFSVSEKPEKLEYSKTTARNWKLKASNVHGEYLGTIQIRLFPWESKDLLLALGGKLNEGTEKVTWDDEKVEGLEFLANLKSVEYMGKNKAGQIEKKLKYVLSNIELSTPF